VSTTTRITGLFDPLTPKKAKRTPAPIGLHLPSFEEGRELESSWQRADELVSKMKQQPLNAVHLGEKIAV
jgi:hypothetical protein